MYSIILLKHTEKLLLVLNLVWHVFEKCHNEILNRSTVGLSIAIARGTSNHVVDNVGPSIQVDVSEKLWNKQQVGGNSNIGK